MQNFLEGQKIVAVAGYFDPLHSGHLSHIREAKKLGDVLVVIAGTELQCDKKHGSHFHSWEEKVELLKLYGADIVVPNVDSDGTCCETLKRIRPHIFAKGGECSKDNVPEMKTCSEIGCEVRFGIGERKNRSSRYFKQ